MDYWRDTVEAPFVEPVGELGSPQEVLTSVWVAHHGSMRVPVPPDSPDAVERVDAWWKTMTFGDHEMLVKMCRVFIDEPRSRVRIPEVDYNEMRRLMVRLALLRWSLPVAIERGDHGWMDDASWRQVAAQPGPLVRCLLRKYEETLMLTDEEESDIMRQAVVLFNPDTPGVSNACEAVTLFCTLENYSSKFGLDADHLRRLPYREYLLLRRLISQENEANRRRSKAGGDKPMARVADARGRVRASRGKVIRNP